MRVPSTRCFIQSGKEFSEKFQTLLIGQIGELWETFQQALNGNLTFGDGADYDNIKGQWVNFTSHATPDTEFTVSHALGVIPIGYLIMRNDKAGVLYLGTTSWTTSAVYLKCNVASTTFRVFLLLGPSET